MREETLALIRDRRLAKGDVLEVARVAGIMAAKRTGDLIPLCHPIGLDSVEVDLRPIDATTLRIEATVKVTGRTGVEMEGADGRGGRGVLTVYDIGRSARRSTGAYRSTRIGSRRNRGAARATTGA